MKVLQINSVCGIRSTGRICTDIADMLMEYGDVCKVAYGRGSVPEKYQHISLPIGSSMSATAHAFEARVFDNAGFGSRWATKRFLHQIDVFAPDLIHLHNIHGYYLNIEQLFFYLKKRAIPVVWTLHDCWAFTGHCSHFTTADCMRWQDGCHDCPLRREYPSSVLLDNSKLNFKKKKTAFCNVQNLHIVTPSNWLGDCVKKSFLKDYPIHTIRNGIDTKAFCPTHPGYISQDRLEGKKIVLGVASTWTERKGFGFFLKLAQLLDETYQVVLVGLNNTQISRLPKNVIGLRKTDSIEHLAQIYSSAYVHVSMSREETMGLTLIEANACGTPVIAFDSTALPEIVEEQTGIIVQRFSPENVADTIMNNDFSKAIFSNRCRLHAQKFEKRRMYSQYIDLYRSLVP